MSVLVDGTARYTWKISTGAKNYTTPSGVYAPQWLARKWFSKKYNNAPMPHSIFFHEGYAIHGTTEISRLGKIASHGCVRLHPENAAKLYEIVQKQMAHTRVVVSDDAIDTPDEAPKKKTNRYVAENKPAAPPVETVALARPDATIMETAANLEKPARSERGERAEARAKPRLERNLRLSYGGGFRW